MTPAIGATKRALRREPAHRRTNQKVRRGSHYARNLVPNTLGRAELNRILGAVRHFDRAQKIAGKRRGCAGTLSPYDVRVLEYLYDLASWFSGRVFPPIAKIAADLGISPSTVGAAKRRLKDLGLLDWTRRCAPKPGMQGVRGPQVEQISNWYHLLVPPFVRAKWDEWARIKAQRAERRSDLDKKLAVLSSLAAHLGPDQLAAAKARAAAGRAGDERDVT